MIERHADRSACMLQGLLFDRFPSQIKLHQVFAQPVCIVDGAALRSNAQPRFAQFLPGSFVFQAVDDGCTVGYA
jgi:hypothetical protein